MFKILKMKPYTEFGDYLLPAADPYIGFYWYHFMPEDPESEMYRIIKQFIFDPYVLASCNYNNCSDIYQAIIEGDMAKAKEIHAKSSGRRAQALFHDNAFIVIESLLAKVKAFVLEETPSSLFIQWCLYQKELSAQVLNKMFILKQQEEGDDDDSMNLFCFSHITFNNGLINITTIIIITRC